MTLFAVACAGLFPLLAPGPAAVFLLAGALPQHDGHLAAVSQPADLGLLCGGTYATVSLLFWYVGLIPDLATLRDRSTAARFRRSSTAFLAMGWRGSARHWRRYQDAYLLLAALATPLVVSVHSVVSFDFAVAIVPGWHSTVFPPYFVAGAIYSGFAMVLTIAIPLRAAYGLQGFRHRPTPRQHGQGDARQRADRGLRLSHGVVHRLVQRPRGGMVFADQNRAIGPYGPLYWLLIACNIVIPQVLWFARRAAKRVRAVRVVALVINVGMWLERFIIVVVSLHRDYLPSSWGMYMPTFWDWSTFIGTIGLFAALMFLFIRLLPMISIFEMREAGGANAGRNTHDGAGTCSDCLPNSPTRDALVAAAQRVHAAGYRRVEALFALSGRGPGRGDRLRCARGCRWSCCSAGIVGGLAGLRAAVLVDGDRVPAECRRPAAA